MRSASDSSTRIAGQPIVFTAGPDTVCTATTDGTGTATCTMSAAATALVVANLGATGSFLGSSTWDPCSASAGLA